MSSILWHLCNSIKKRVFWYILVKKAKKPQKNEEKSSFSLIKRNLNKKEDGDPKGDSTAHLLEKFWPKKYNNGSYLTPTPFLLKSYSNLIKIIL